MAEARPVALERSLDRYWAAQGTPLDGCLARARLICLRTRHEDPDLARRGVEVCIATLERFGA